MKSAIALVVLSFACVALAADVTGTWNATTQGPDGQEMKLVFHLKQDGDKLSGTVEGPAGEVAIKEGSVNGDAIEFTVELNEMKIVHKGTVSGDEMKLHVEIGEQTMEMTAKREK